MIYSTRRFVLCLNTVLFCSCVFSVLLALHLLAWGRGANLSAFRMFVRFVLVSSSSSCLERAAVCGCGTP